MKHSTAVLLAIFAPVHSLLSHSVVNRQVGRNTHPVEGVISTLGRLRAQVVQEGQDEELTYAKFAKWCEDSKRTLQTAVSASKASIESLQNVVAARRAEYATLTEQLANLADEISHLEGANSQTEQGRQAANQRYREVDQDFADTITAFEGAIQALEEARPDGAALVQKIVGKVPAMALLHLSDRQVSMLMDAGANSSGNSSDDTGGDSSGNSSGDTGGDRPDLLARGDYGKHTRTYSFKSGNVVELLKQLKASFEEQRLEATRAETNAANANELAKDARDRAIQAAKDVQSAKGSELQECQGDLVASNSSLSDAQDDLSIDSSSLSGTATQCSMKKTEWDERSATRTRELVAIDEGVKILAKVAGVRIAAPENPILPSMGFVQETSALLFLQTDPRERVVTLLKSEAARLHSKAFKRFAAEVEARASGPFDQVNNMIQKMIFRLMAEQKNEDEHKNWCDHEMSKTGESKQRKQDKSTELGLNIDEAQSSIGELAQQIIAANNMVSKIDSFVAEATEIRSIGKRENAAAIADAKAAQSAIAKAISVLEDFYKSTGLIAKESWEFIQKGTEPVTLPNSPSTWDSAVYAGGADPKDQENGVIAILERIASEFSTMQASTLAQEATDEKNYQDEMKTQQIERARRSEEAEIKTQDKQRLVEHISSLQKSQKNTQEALAATKQYLKDLEPACVEGDSTYEDRMSARSDEIDALKEAQLILTDAFNENSTEPVNGSSMLLDMQGGRSFHAPVRPSH